MAVVTGTARSAFGFTSGTGPTLQSTISSDEYETGGCFVTADFTSGTYASADNAQFDAATLIESGKRDGKTVTLMGACFVSAGQENGSTVGAKTVAVSGDNVTCELTQEDLSTEHADGAMNATWGKPITFFVSYRTKVNGE